MPRVVIPSPFQGPTQGRGELEVEGTTIRECLDAVEAEYKGFLAQVVKPDGEVQRFAKLFVNEEQVVGGDLDTKLERDDRIEILAAIGGG
jgi:molybdopterin converting factor small subunit